MLHCVHTTYTLIYIYTHSLSSEDVMTGWYTHDLLLSVNVIMFVWDLGESYVLYDSVNLVSGVIGLCSFRMGTAITFFKGQGQVCASPRCIFSAFCKSKIKVKTSFHVRHKKKAPLSWKHACLNHKRYSHIPKLWRNSLNFMPRITLKNNFCYVSHTAMKWTCGQVGSQCSALKISADGKNVSGIFVTRQVVH